MADFEVAANVTRELEAADARLQHEWYYLILAVVPIACIVGNGLVVTAVWTNKSLQTPTNYLLVSLAMADLLVGAFVMPFSIYLSINGLHWHLPLPVCHIYCVLDVAASTSSIVHLVLISIDRLVAATKPAEYKTPKHRRRVYIAIALTWLFSIGLSLPLGTGFNTKTRQFLLIEHHCGIYNPIYMFCSSIFAFYLPCFVMIITYGYIFYTLRKRLRAIKLQEMAGGQFFNFGADVGNIATSAMQSVIGIAPKNRNMISWEKPLLRKIEETAAEHASSLDDSEREQLQTILEAVQPSSTGSNELTTTFEEDPDRPPSVVLEAVTLQPPSECGSGSSGPVLEVPRRFRNKGYGRRFSDAVQTTLAGNPRRKSVTICTVPPRRHSYDPRQDQAEEAPRSHSLRPPRVEKRKMRRLSELISEWERPSRSSLSGFSHMYSFARRESVYIARKKLAGLKDWALDLIAKLRSKQGMAIRREARATKLVATVMVVFLACWLPFFTLNMIKVYKLMFNYWSPDLEILFHWFTALGYLNSSLNVFIYSAINQKFRSSFRRLIGFRSRRRRDKTWMLPPKDSSRGVGKYCSCGPFHKMGKKTTLRKASSAGMLNRKISMIKPEIVIDEVSKSSQKHISISAGGITTFRRSSDDCIRRSSSEIIGGVTFPSNHESRRSSQMSNSSASLQLHDMHQLTLSIEVEHHHAATPRFDLENDQVEIFV